jgi:hypothetical protein
MPTATDLRLHLARLQAERHEAVAIGLDRNELYMDELEADLAETRHSYVLMAVTEIATLRAELGDAGHG